MKNRVAELLAENKLYEAQQMYHMRYNRASSRARHEEAAATVEEGAAVMLRHGEDVAGGELARKMVESWRASGAEADEARVGAALRLLALFSAGGGAEHAAAFGREAVAWSAEHGPHPQGDPALHLALARLLPHDRAQRHWLRAARPDLHARQLARWCDEGGLEGERDLFVARAVLQYLALGNLADANALVRGSQPGDTPLANFCRFLLRAAERDAPPLFEMLRSRYADSLARDPDLGKYLDRVGAELFGLEPPKGMLEELMGMVGAQ